jgi:hypothetical protein
MAMPRSRSYHASTVKVLGVEPLIAHAEVARIAVLYEDLRIELNAASEECLDRLIPFGERHFRRAVAEFVAHYHRERNHQGLANELIEGPAADARIGRIRRRQRLGGLLNYYARAA